MCCGPAGGVMGALEMLSDGGYAENLDSIYKSPGKFIQHSAGAVLVRYRRGLAGQSAVVVRISFWLRFVQPQKPPAHLNDTSCQAGGAVYGAIGRIRAVGCVLGLEVFAPTRRGTLLCEKFFVEARA